MNNTSSYWATSELELAFDSLLQQAQHYSTTGEFEKAASALAEIKELQLTNKLLKS